MSDMSDVVAFEDGQVEIWHAAQGLRFAMPEKTTTEPPKLQQLWEELTTGKTEWREVPHIVVSDEDYRR